MNASLDSKAITRRSYWYPNWWQRVGPSTSLIILGFQATNHRLWTQTKLHPRPHTPIAIYYSQHHIVGSRCGWGWRSSNILVASSTYLHLVLLCMIQPYCCHAPDITNLLGHTLVDPVDLYQEAMSSLTQHVCILVYDVIPPWRP